MKIVLIPLTAILFAGSAGAAFYVQRDRAPKDVPGHLARLQKVEADLNFLQTDLSVIQQHLAALPQGQLTSDNMQIVQERISNEQAGIQTDLGQIVADEGFLKSHWSSLTLEQKAFVNSIRRN